LHCQLGEVGLYCVVCPVSPVVCLAIPFVGCWQAASEAALVHGAPQAQVWVESAASDDSEWVWGTALWQAAKGMGSISNPPLAQKFKSLPRAGWLAA